MALGSPVSASSGQGVYPNQQQTGPQYLPGYLMGDISSQVKKLLEYSVSCLFSSVFFFLPNRVEAALSKQVQ